MPRDDLSWKRDWRMHLAASIRRGDELVLGKEDLELLRAIDRWRSISEAGRQLGRSYRWTWLAVQRVNAAAGEPLVQAATGGKQGGGAALTPRGKQAVAMLVEMQSQLEGTAAQLLRRWAERDDAGTPLHVFAAISLQEAIGQIVNDFALVRPDLPVRTVFGASNELVDQLLAGAPGDLFVSADGFQIDRLLKERRAREASRRVVAHNTLALAMPADHPSAVRKPAHLKQSSVACVALASPDCPLGRYTQECLSNLGLYEAVRTKSLVVDNSRAVLAALRAGQADAGLTFTSDVLSAPDLQVRWRSKPGEPKIECHAALVGDGARSDAAGEVLSFLGSDAAAVRWRNCGFDQAAT